MKQTAVEWLYDQLEFDDSISMETIHNVFEQAKEMEKQQIIEAFIGYDSDTEDNLEVAEQYYNETFKK
jgi:hypothetical protein